MNTQQTAQLFLDEALETSRKHRKALGPTTPATVARRVARELVRQEGLEDLARRRPTSLDLPAVWSPTKAREQGWTYGGACWQVCLEGAYEWPYKMTERVNRGEFGSGVFAEPATGFILSLYPE